MLNLQLCNLGCCCSGSQASGFRPLTGHHTRQKGNPCPRPFAARPEAERIAVHHIYCGCICHPLLPKAMQCVLWNIAPGQHSSPLLCSLPPTSALPAFAEIPSLGFASRMVAANTSGGGKPDFAVYKRERCAGGCVFQERGVRYSFSFTRLNNSKNVPLCSLYPLAL